MAFMCTSHAYISRSVQSSGVIFMLLSCFLATAFARCYSPDLEVSANASSDFHASCNESFANDGFSMCCKTIAPFNSICLGNGLCQNNNTDPSLGLTASIYRSGCTDPTWKSDSCLHFCTTGTDWQGKPSNASDEFVKQCDNGSYCCGTANAGQNTEATDCCSKGQGFFLDKGKITPANATASAAPASTTTGASTAKTTPNPPSSNTGAIAGGVVGGVVALAALSVCLWLFFRRRRRQSRGVTAAEGADGGRADNTIRARGVHELDSNSRPVEKDGDERFEKDADLLESLMKSPVEKDGIQFGGDAGGPHEIHTPGPWDTKSP